MCTSSPLTFSIFPHELPICSCSCPLKDVTSPGTNGARLAQFCTVDIECYDRYLPDMLYTLFFFTVDGLQLLLLRYTSMAYPLLSFTTAVYTGSVGLDTLSVPRSSCTSTIRLSKRAPNPSSCSKPMMVLGPHEQHFRSCAGLGRHQLSLVTTAAPHISTARALCMLAVLHLSLHLFCSLHLKCLPSYGT
jgi:hypothetical protein